MSPTRPTRSAKATRAASTPKGQRKTAPGPFPESDSRSANPGAPDLLDMDQAIALLKTTRPTFYRWLRAGQVRGMKVGRQWRFDRAELERFLRGEQPQVELPVSPQPLAQRLAERLAALHVPEVGPEEIAHAPPSPLTRVFLQLVRLGQSLRASDIHIEPVAGVGGTPTVRVRARVDGALHHLTDIDPRLLPALADTAKRLGSCDPREKRVPQDCRLVIQTAKPPEPLRRVDLRMSFLPCHLGEAITLRLLSAQEVILDLDRIPYAPRDAQSLRKHLQSPWGLILCTGPAGSGKTTTLYACLNFITRPHVKVISIEDPVEYLLPGVCQVGVDAAAGMGFPRAARAAFTSDPDVLMVGEIRDLDTLNIVCQATLTGHLVLSTLHTGSAGGALIRMADMGMDPFVIADAAKLIVGQRLVRQLCPHCSVAAAPDPRMLAQAREVGKHGGLDIDAGEARFRKAVGCARCSQTGFRGRLPVAEMLEVTYEIGAALRRGASAAELTALGVSQGMTTIAADAIRRATLGQTALEEALHAAPGE